MEGRDKDPFHFAREAGLIFAHEAYLHWYTTIAGTDLQRAIIAASMVEIDLIEPFRAELSPQDQEIFMITFECFVVWALTVGIRRHLPADEFELAFYAIKRHFAEHAWYEQAAFAKIWRQMDELMPLAMENDPDGSPPYPAAEMIEAANLAGYNLDHSRFGVNFKFGMHIRLSVCRLLDFGLKLVHK